MLTADFVELLYTTYSAAALISSALFLDIYITYENYKHRMPYKILTPIIIQVCLIALVILFCGFDNIVNALVNGAIVDTLKPILASIGGLSIVVPSIYLLVSTKQPSTHKNTNVAAPPAQVIEPEDLCKKLKRAISGNAIAVSFVRKQWDFMPGETVSFGYDKKTDCFIFVSNTFSKVIEHKRIV